MAQCDRLIQVSYRIRSTELAGVHSEVLILNYSYMIMPDLLRIMHCDMCSEK